MGKFTTSGSLESYANEDALCKAFMKNIWQRRDAGLLAPGCIYFHIPNQLSRQKNNDPMAYARIGAKLKAMGVRAGVPDYQFIWRDITGQRVAFLEAKMPGNSLSPAQDLFIQDLRMQGIEVAVFRSVQEGLRHLQDWGVLKREKYV